MKRVFAPLVVAHLGLFELAHTSNDKLTVHRNGSTNRDDEQQREEEKKDLFSLKIPSHPVFASQTHHTMLQHSQKKTVAERENRK